MQYRHGPPALLLGGLNMVRALGLGGVRVIVASPDRDAPAMRSRYACAGLRLPPLTERAAVVETLARAGERLGGAAGCKLPLFYSNDDYLSLVQENHAALARYFTLVLNPPAVAQALIDKDRFEGFARGRGLPVPRTLAWDELERWEAPVLVKPKVKIGYDDWPVRVELFERGKARVFASGPELATYPLARRLRDKLLLQEYVAGDDRQLWSFHGYADENGELLAWFVGRKLRTYPLLTGQSAFLEMVHDRVFAEVGREAAARVPLRGVFKIDFKQDAVTGAWRLLEVNARFNLWHYLAARNGLNLPRIAYDYLTRGERPAAWDYATTYRWLSLRHDYRAYRALAARGELGFWAWLRSIVRAPRVYDILSWTDPLPFALHCLSRARRIPRLPMRVKQWLSTVS
jgi:predicted ATP-grasp superfamily ATP-dependent carboligase